jgi:hypothetical protein
MEKKMLRMATPEDINTINGILNHPSVYPNATLGQDIGPMDIGPQLLAENLFVLMVNDGDGGCFILDPYDDNVAMEIHTCILPDHRGKEAEITVSEVLRFAFGQLGTPKLFTRISVNNKGADLFARQMGFVRISNGEDLRSYELTASRWPSQDHTLGELAIPEMSALVNDLHFFKMAGAFALMANNDYMGRGVALFNEHARLHGFPRIYIVGPDSIMVGGLIIHFDVRNEPRVEDISCQLQQQLPQ